MNRAERFAEGEGNRRVNVGFALMILQRRLASSPEAIYRSLVRRRERLESRLGEERIIISRWPDRKLEPSDSVLDDIDERPVDEAYDEAPQDEREELEARLVDYATAAATIEELEIEIERLKQLQELARSVVSSGQDAKWNQLNTILDDPLMMDEAGNRRKLVDLHRVQGHPRLPGPAHPQPPGPGRSRGGNPRPRHPGGTPPGGPRLYERSRRAGADCQRCCRARASTCSAPT